MGATTGNVIIESNATTEIKSPDITLESSDILKLEGEKRVVIDSTGRIFLEGLVKVIEGVDVFHWQRTPETLRPYKSYCC